MKLNMHIVSQSSNTHGQNQHGATVYFFQLLLVITKKNNISLSQYFIIFL